MQSSPQYKPQNALNHMSFLRKSKRFIAHEKRAFSPAVFLQQVRMFSTCKTEQGASPLTTLFLANIKANNAITASAIPQDTQRSQQH